MIDAALRKLGYSEFRPGQREVIEASVAGKDTIAIMPTGRGKSLCYQLPAMLSEGLTVVISPLVSLMTDQVRSATERGIPAAQINYALTHYQLREVYSAMYRRTLKLLYVSPERLMNPQFLSTLAGARVSAFVIDEAHCVVEWGAEFRPSYRRLLNVVAGFPAARRSAFTATATLETQQTIETSLGLRHPFRLRTTFDRPNLIYAVAQKREERYEFEQIMEHVEAGRGPGIIYRTTRAQVEETVRRMVCNGFDALPYHAGLDAVVREKNQEAFLRGRVDTLVGTIAFGMGIDKPDVRWVLHADIPKNIESYYQETGRAGRDGQQSRCTMLFSKRDIPMTRGFIDRSLDDDQRRKAYKQFVEVLTFAQLKSCRRQALLSYFGEVHGGGCGSCDNCQRNDRRNASCVSNTQPGQMTRGASSAS